MFLLDRFQPWDSRSVSLRQLLIFHTTVDVKRPTPATQHCTRNNILPNAIRQCHDLINVWKHIIQLNHISNVINSLSICRRRLDLITALPQHIASYLDGFLYFLKFYSCETECETQKVPKLGFIKTA